MTETEGKGLYEVTLGALLHDIGEFMQRAELEKQFPEIEKNYGEFCPLDEHGKPGYLHAAHTAYFVEHFLPDGLFDRAELQQAARHHVSNAEDIYKVADILSSDMECHGEEVGPGNSKHVRMHSIFDMVELQYVIRDKEGHLNSRWTHRLVAHSEKNLQGMFPVFDEKGQIDDAGFTYRSLWEEFSREAKELKTLNDLPAYFTELYWLMEKYTCCIPSATNAFPDISLFDHARTTAAIASCLYLAKEDSVGTKPEFLLFGGDISGIQEYIFKISQSQGVGGIAKRLRGRSFYIAMLSEVLSRYLLNKLHLTQANVNFCGGGNFEILLPNTEKTQRVLDSFETDVNDWLLSEFQGELGFVGAQVSIPREDLRNNFAGKKDELGDALNSAKLRKYRTHLVDAGFWREQRSDGIRITVCKSCNLNLVSSEVTLCNSCDRDKEIGEQLPGAAYLTFSSAGETGAVTFGESGVFGSVRLWKATADPSVMRKTGVTAYAMVEGHDKVKAHFRLARTVPKATKQLELATEADDDGNNTVRDGQSFSFATLADMAQGDTRIGILKMDVDNLGLIFSMGLEASEVAQKQEKLRSISRLSTISRQLSFFFTTYLDSICENVFNRWRDDPANIWPDKESVSNIFYLIFAGGDDLVIVGPWDRIIELAQEIRKEFKAFTCHNPNITLSAGIYICKPKYPISHGVKKAEEALKQSKDSGRNRITVMGETAVWAKEDPRSRVLQENLKSRYPSEIFLRNEIAGESVFMAERGEAETIDTLTFEELAQFSDILQEHLDKGHISHGFVRSLLEAKEQFFSAKYNDQEDRYEEQHNLMVLPHLLYAIERNVHKEVRDDLKSLVVTEGRAQAYIRQAYFPCRYISMKRR